MNQQMKLNATAVCTIVCALLVPSQVTAHPRSQVQVETQKSATKTVKTYACPMHPEVKSTKKGKCPKCKMDLQPVRETTSEVEKETPVSSVAVGEIVNADNSSAAGSGSSKRLVIPDVQVLDQDGRTLHFYTDLIKGKTVAINFIFTNCTTICPPLAATFARVQKEMGDKVGKDVHFISISVDPLTDTPERLKAWGAKFKAGAGWTFVTGNKEEMDKLLDALGASVARREDHTPSVIVGNDARSIWTRTYGLARPSLMVGLIENVLAGKLDDQQAVKEPAQP
jgi:cytochrome oxidase Cu insertion factor (SCO1/SenC/PrrC family)